MSKFRKFFEAVAKPSGLSGKGYYGGLLKLPNIDPRSAPGYTPVGGHQSLQGIAQNTSLDEETQARKMVLDVLSEFAKNVTQNLDNQASGLATNIDYTGAYMPDGNTIKNLNPKYVEGQTNERHKLSENQLALARKMGIVVDDPAHPGMIAINLIKLRSEITNMQGVLLKSERRGYYASGVDRASSAMSSGGTIQRRPGT